MITNMFNQCNCQKLILELVRTFDFCRPIIESSQTELCIFPLMQGTHSIVSEFNESMKTRCNEILHAISNKLKLVIPKFIWPMPQRPTSIETALSKFCSLTVEDWQHIGCCIIPNSIINNLNLSNLTTRAIKYNIHSSHMPRFTVYSQGNSSKEAIILIPPCAVPLKLFQPWLDTFANEFCVFISENPFLFGDWRYLSDPTGDVFYETKYIGSILQENNISRAHLLGICGGAPIALAAAAQFKQQIASVVICHGDLNFGPHTPRTLFQDQFHGLLSEAVSNVKRAEEVYSLFLDPALLFGVPNQVGPFILYPYTNLNLFQRYAKINLALMAFDATEVANKLTQPVMIITSRKDRLTHPQASHLLHQTVKHSVLWERNTGNHHDILLGDQELFSTISQFLKTFNNVSPRE